MAETTSAFDALNTDHPWRNGHSSMAGTGDMVGNVDNQQLAMGVEMEPCRNDGNDGSGATGDEQQAYMFMSDGTELQTLSGGLFSSETFPSRTTEVEERHSGELLPISALNAVDGAAKPNGTEATSHADPRDATSTGCEKLENLHPLGSSQNPIRIIQQGNKYTSLQELSHDQLSQIMQVIQQQKMLQTNRPSVIFNPETQTKIIYRVVYPSDIHRGAKPTPPAAECRKRPHQSRDDPEQSQRPAKKMRHRRTRSGRVCRPPQYMVKDYKHINPVYLEVDDVAGAGGYSDFRESSGDEANGGDNNIPNKRAIFDFDDSIPTVYNCGSRYRSVVYTYLAASGKPKSFKCATCEKRYIGLCGLARHYRLQPEHGSPDDLIPAAGATENGENSLDSASSHAVTSGLEGSGSGVPVVDLDTCSAEKAAETSAEDSSLIPAISSTPAELPSATSAASSVAPPVKRKRGRPPLHSKQASERRQQKLSELMRTCTSEDLMDVVLPHLASYLSLWQYLTARAGAMSSSSPRTTDCAASVATRAPDSGIDVAMILDEYEALQRSVQNFCNDRLETDTRLSEDRGETAVQVSATDSAGGDTFKDLQDCGPVEDSTDSSTVTNANTSDNVKHVCLHVGSVESCSEIMHAPAEVDNAGNRSCEPVNGMDSDHGMTPNSDCCNSLDAAEHDVVNSDKLSTDTCAAAADRFPSSNGVDHTSELLETPSVSNAETEKLHDPGLASSDCFTTNGNTTPKDVDSEVVEMRQTSVEDRLQATESDELDAMLPESGNNTRPETGVQCSCTDTGVETPSGVVMVINDALKISNVELARCLGLLPETRYRMKEEEETESRDATELRTLLPEFQPAKIADNTALVGKTSDHDVVLTPTLPPRKRLKAFKVEHTTDSTGVFNNYVSEMDKSGKTDTGLEDNVLSSMLDREQSAVEGNMADTAGAPLANVTFDANHMYASSGDRLVSVCSPETSDSTAKNSFAPLSAPLLQAKPTVQQQQPTRRGRKPHPTSLVAVAANPLPAAVQQNWSSETTGTEVSITPSLVAVPAVTPNLIHIPPDAKVIQTDDGMVIVCNSDGTVQIHGHTEGRPIPLDAIRTVLGLDTEGYQTLLTVSDNDHILGEQTQTLCSQPVSLTEPRSMYEMENAQPVVTMDGTQTLMSVDGRQYVTMDDGQALMAYDPSCQSVIQLDPSQAIITLSDDGSAFVAVDGTQPVLSVDGECYADQGVVSTLTLMQ